MNRLNRAQKFILTKILGIGEDSIDKLTSIGINGEDIEDKQTVTDPTGKFAKPAFLSYMRGANPPNNVTFHQSEYDLYTIANARQLDGILNRAIGIFKEQILKNGYEIISKTDRAHKHLQKRMREIELSTNIKFRELVTTVADQLVTYGNAYVIKVRKDTSRYGRRYKLFNKTLKPIVGLFVADATTMKVGLKNNMVDKYEQNIKGETRYFDAKDVIHLTYNKIPGTLTGMSNFNMVLDDIRALRKLEEELEILGFQYAIPLYIYKVGTDTHPAEGTEVSNVREAINNGPTYGIMVVPHTHDMQAVTSKNDSIDIIKYVEHFKQRAYAGIGVSPVAMGEMSSSNRNTSEIADISMQNITKSYQTIISSKFEQELLSEILLDGNFDPMSINSEMRFPEIDLEAQVKKETNILQKYQGNLIGLSEARAEGDYEPKVDEKELYINKVQIPLIEAEGKAQAQVAKVSAANRGAVGSSAKSKTKASEKSISSKSKPTNQHGTSLGRPKIKKDHLVEAGNFCKTLGHVLLLDDAYESNLNRGKYLEKVRQKLKSTIKKQLKYTLDMYSEYYHLDSYTPDSDIIDEVCKYYLIRITDKVNRMSKFESGSDLKVDHILNDVKNFISVDTKLENLAKIIILKKNGFSSILYNADECELHSDWDMDLNDFSMDQVPPLSYGCGCTVSNPLIDITNEE